MANKSIAEISANAAVLITAFAELPKGETLAYEQIAKLIGYDLRKDRGIMNTVRNRLLRDHDKILSAVHTVGYKVVTDADAVDGTLRGQREHRRRSAARSKLTAGAIDTSKLNEVQRIGLLAEITAAHVTMDVSGDRSIKKLSSSMNGSATPLALNVALESLKHNV